MGAKKKKKEILNSKLYKKNTLWSVEISANYYHCTILVRNLASCCKSFPIQARSQKLALVNHQADVFLSTNTAPT